MLRSDALAQLLSQKAIIPVVATRGSIQHGSESPTSSIKFLRPVLFTFQIGARGGAAIGGVHPSREHLRRVWIRILRSCREHGSYIHSHRQSAICHLFQA